MEHSSKVFWEKVKDAGEFTAGIVAIVAVLYGLSWLADDILGHAHIHIDHHWWAYKLWHAWWWVTAPLAMVIVGRVWHRQIIGKGLWVVGVLWLAFLGFGGGMALWGRLLMSLVVPFGWLIGSVLMLAGVLLIGFGFAILGELIYRARVRWPRIDRVITEICWTPDSTSKSESSRTVQ
jgi:hypothetical protein